MINRKNKLTLLLVVLAALVFASTTSAAKHHGKPADAVTATKSFSCLAGICTFTVTGVTQDVDTQMWTTVKFTPTDTSVKGCNSGSNAYVDEGGTVTVQYPEAAIECSTDHVSVFPGTITSVWLHANPPSSDPPVTLSDGSQAILTNIPIS